MLVTAPSTTVEQTGVALKLTLHWAILQRNELSAGYSNKRARRSSKNRVTAVLGRSQFKAGEELSRRVCKGNHNNLELRRSCAWLRSFEINLFECRVTDKVIKQRADASEHEQTKITKLRAKYSGPERRIPRRNASNSEVLNIQYGGSDCRSSKLLAPATQKQS